MGMSKTLYLRDLIKATLTDSNYQIYENEAPEGATYPYVVFEISTNGEQEYPTNGILEINAWDRHNTYSRVDNIVDIIESKLKHQFFKNEYVAFRTFDGVRNHIPDEDKAIKRTREKLIIRYNSMEGE